MRFVSPYGAGFDLYPHSFACNPTHDVINALSELNISTYKFSNRLSLTPSSSHMCRDTIYHPIPRTRPCGAGFDLYPHCFACDPNQSVDNAHIELTLPTVTLGNRRLSRPAPNSPRLPPPHRPHAKRRSQTHNSYRTGCSALIYPHQQPTQPLE